jgi:hypothetical protein
MPGNNCVRQVDQDLAQIIRIPGSGRETIVDQTGSQSQRVMLLRVRSKMQKHSYAIAENRGYDYPWLKLNVAAQ